MVKFSLIISWVLIISLQAISQVPGYFPEIDTNELPGAKIGIPAIYSGSSLYGYMNGGADLYLEYGVVGAWISEVEYAGGKHIIEIFRMSCAEEAFGIFSVSRYQCNSTPALSRFSCQTPYQLQLVKGPFYINIINTKADSACSAAALKIGEAILKKIGEEPPDLSGYFPGIPLEILNRNAILVKGELGVRNGAPDLYKYFTGAEGYTAVIAQLDEGTVISVKFSAQEPMEAFLAKFTSEIKQLSGGAESLPGDEIIKKISDLHLMVKLQKN